MTIYDIAKACNVSIATVSRVLNGSTKVSPKTRAKVLAMMNEQKYTPNPFARGLGLNSMKMVGILCTDVSDAFFAKAVSLAERGLRKRDLDVILGCTGLELADKKKYLQFMMDKHVDAILLIGSPFRELLDNSHLENTAKEIPLVAINSLIDAPNIYCVLCDELEGMRNSVELLHNQGHEKILYLYDSLTFSGQQKITGYKKGLENFGIPIDEKLMHQIPKSMEAAAAITEKLLDENVEFTAVLTSEDILAVGSQKALIKRGKASPIIGFNNSILAQCSTPALSSVDNRLDVLCPAAVDIIAKVLEGDGDLIPTKSVFPPIFVERDSFKKA